MKPVYRNSILSVVALAILFTGFMGFAHTPAGRPALVFLGKLMGKKEFCPLGYDHQASFEEREQVRKRMAAQHAGRAPTSSATAFDFTLGKTLKPEVSRWVAERKGECRQTAGAAEMECVGPFFQEANGTLWLEFDREDRLVGARGVEMFQAQKQAWEMYSRVRADLRAKGDPKLTEAGATKPAELSGLLAQSSIITDFSNYSATVRVANMGKQGYALTHDFRIF